jgi:lipid-binding SYLF domain-containing protein
MKKSCWKILLCFTLLFTLLFATVSATTVEQRKAELHQKVAVTLDTLYQKQPKAKSVVTNAAGYAVFVNTGYQLGLFGSAHGRGMAVNNVTGEEVYMRMKEYKVGLGIGIKEYSLVFVFANQDTWKTFVDKGWAFGGEATAAASDGVNGDAMEGAFQVAPGVWLYQMTTKGLSADLSIKGTNYYRDMDFYPKAKK